MTTTRITPGAPPNTTSTTRAPKGRAPKGYRADEHPPFAVTVDIVWLTVRAGRLNVLLIERSRAPYARRWAFPGGFVDIDEDLPDAAQRELLEETGLEALPFGAHLEQLGTYGQPGRDPRMRVVSVAYIAFTPNVGDPIAGDDARRARWWPIDDLTTESMALAFDHGQILADAVERTRSKLEYTTLAMAFVDEPFTLSELRAVYEAVWGHDLEPSNFRRKLLENPGVVEPADNRRGLIQPGPGRPAQLYRRGDVSRFARPIERRAD